jgi:YteA family regulatory protein
MITSEQIHTLKQQLEEGKLAIEHQLERTAQYNMAQSNPKDSVGELSSYDNHPGDQGTELYEREKDYALSEHDDDEVKKITAALSAIQNDTYGKCRVCHEDIPYERLEAVPYTLYCKAHSTDQTPAQDRPVEDELLDLNYMSNTHRYDGDESVEYDAEDTWQAVAQWGTSETPSDMENPPQDLDDMYKEANENVGYTEDFENFIGTDIEGRQKEVYKNESYEEYNNALEEQGTMTSFGDLPRNEKDSYVHPEKTK